MIDGDTILLLYCYTSYIFEIFQTSFNLTSKAACTDEYCEISFDIYLIGLLLLNLSVGTNFGTSEVSITNLFTENGNYSPEMGKFVIKCIMKNCTIDDLLQDQWITKETSVSLDISIVEASAYLNGITFSKSRNSQYRWKYEIK